MLRGEQHLDQQAFEDAAHAYHQALLLAPENRYARFWLGESLFHLGRYADTVAVLTDLDVGNDTALALECALTLGRALQRTGSAALAEVTLLQAFVAHPHSEAAAYNLAVFYEQENQPAQALQFLEPSVQRFPQSARLHYNLGANCAACGLTEAAVQAFEQTLRIDPVHLQAHQNLALIHLRQGQLQTGWMHYAWRFNRHQMEGAPAQWTPRTPQLPADLTGVTVALRGEQGLGDEMFFLRYLPQLKARRATVVYQPCNTKLLPLLALWQVQGLIDYVLAPDSQAEEGALALLIGDLPLALGALDYPPSLRLTANQAAVQSWRQRYPLLARERPRVGLTWRAGMAQPQADARGNRWLSKEVSLPALIALLEPLDVDVVILQRKPAPDELAWVQAQLGPKRCLDASGFDHDLTELLALLSTLDSLLGVSNTNVHLMAALGKGGDILVPSPAEFRWQDTGNPSPWFTGFQVGRQQQNGGWDGALDLLQTTLAKRYPARP